MDKNNDGQGLITGRPIQLSILNDVNWMIEWTRIPSRRRLGRCGDVVDVADVVDVVFR